LRRLTRIHVRSVEQPVNLDDGDDAFNYPWLYAVEVGHWQHAKGRLVVAICHNMDLGDAWEYADDRVTTRSSRRWRSGSFRTTSFIRCRTNFP
jgi:hypothetical protein